MMRRPFILLYPGSARVLLIIEISVIANDGEKPARYPQGYGGWRFYDGVRAWNCERERALFG